MVLVRLGTLALMYREFCDLAFEESTESEGEWDELNIDPFRVGQLIGADFERDDDQDADSLARAALNELSESARPETYEALKKGFGGDSALFASLWRTPTDGKRQEQESLYETLNEVTPQKGAAFDWICEGMPLLH